ncbi:MAG: bifunctional methylenetetrahydrofolate dehydrogenase/methenyltetrahydrofolate cyclohydrolase FolD [Erysipelotrichaceae bacterium]
MDKILRGSEVAQATQLQLKKQIEHLQRPPHLVVLLVGDHAASMTYVKNKEKACAMVGMHSTVLRYDGDIQEAFLLEEIQRLNVDAEVDGILVQLPLPKHMNTNKVLETVTPKKDVDGFHPVNIGKTMLHLSGLQPCTPKGVMALLKAYQIELAGKHAVIVGRSNIVGKPLIPLLLEQDATVTCVHSQTKDIKTITAQADILLVAIGKAKYIKKEWIKEGAILIDIGINRDEQGKLCGDIDFEDVYEKCGMITPVPKGVGPMTIAMLLTNTLEAYQRRTHDGI